MTRPHAWHDDARLSAVLASVGEHLVLPDVVRTDVASSDVAGTDTVRTHTDGGGLRRGRWPALAVAAAVAVVLLVIGVVVAPVREAVASWLGLGSTRIERLPAGEADPSGLPPLNAGMAPVTRSETVRALGAPVPEVTDPRLGDPDAMAIPPEGGVILAWDRGATTLWVQAATDDSTRTKRVPFDGAGAVGTVTGLGGEALLIDGDHVLVTPGRQAAAGTVLLWTEDDFEYRLESELDGEVMVAIARSVQHSPG